MVNGINSSQLPYAGYPANAVGATPVTRDIASYCYDTQRPHVAKTYGYLTGEHKESYTWPVIGLISSLVALGIVNTIKRGRI